MRQSMPACSRRAFLTGLATLPVAVRAAAPLKFGYAAITWGADNEGAIEDISALGFAGIQFRAEVVETFTPAQLHERLRSKALTFIALSSGQLALGYHNHLNTLSQTPEGFEMIMAASDPRYVQVVLDTAHALAGGGDPAKMIETCQDRLLFLHLKDVVDLPDDPTAKYPFQWVELGRGRVDIPGVFNAIDRIGFRDWVVVELDRVPVKNRTPKDSAAINRAYLEKAARI